ncbi:unnamed protein product [Brachionus calyciflorus]|uniref:Uncharacterized protein n=1 Tax=Brachionus calyciflorus TaxID=104777 RepID=A0A814IZL2_9BILA|nr:unnamed protein product [Brachionus calyciflorus]
MANDPAFYEFDPTFNEELVPMEPNDGFLDAETLFKCKKMFKFIDCLEHYLKKKYSSDSYNNRIIDEAVLNYDTDQKTLKEKRNPNKDELLWFIRNAIAKNHKIKPNIKTTRF